MRVTWKHRLAAGTLCLAASFGCGNPLTTMAFLLHGTDENKTPPDFPLKPADKKDDVKVLVLVSSAVGIDPDFVGVDRALAAEFNDALKARLKANKEKTVTLKESKVIEDWKSENPDWKALPPADIGKKFEADYVIDIEILEMQLYEPGSHGQFLRCRANLSVRAYDLARKLPKEAAFKFDYAKTSPAENPIPVESAAGTSSYRLSFLKKVANDLSMKFSAYAPDEKVQIGRGD